MQLDTLEATIYYQSEFVLVKIIPFLSLSHALRSWQIYFHLYSEVSKCCAVTIEEHPTMTGREETLGGIALIQTKYKLKGCLTVYSVCIDRTVDVNEQWSGPTNYWSRNDCGKRIHISHV